MKFNFPSYLLYMRSLFLFFLLSSIVACGALTGSPPEDPRDTPARELTLFEQAVAAYNAGDMPKAEQLYSHVVLDTTITKEQRLKAWQPYILASLANKHPYSAIENMKKWQAASPAAPAYNAWQRTWLKIITSLPPYEQKRRVDIALQEGSPIERVLAESLLLAQGKLSPDAQATVLSQLQTFYTRLTKNQRAALERALFNAMRYSTTPVLSPLLAQTGPERDHVFPWTIILLESLRREQLNRGLNVQSLRSRIDNPSLFADYTLLSNVVKTKTQEETRLPDLQNICIALALPMSGPYSPIAWKVSRGASVAQAELMAAGQRLELVILNTDQPSWIERLAALPPQCVTIGGPMQPNAYRTLKQQDLLRTRALFAFLPQLDEGDEGTIAWRFFSSQTDQIRVPLEFTKNLGLHSYAVLAPEEPYGERMTSLFANQLGAMPPIATFNPNDSTTWNKVTSDFIGVTMVNDIPIPQTTMQAVFLPDTWQNAEIMIPYILFQGEDRLVFIGTTLWEQGLSRALQSSLQSMQLAIFPGVWNHTSPSPRASHLIANMEATGQEAPDLWVGLGYDFVRFAASLYLPKDFTADQVNTRLLQAQNMDWSMAPIHWSQGQASQELFLFTPSSQGPVIANPATFSKRLQRIYARHERRIAKARAEARAKKNKK